MARNIKVIPSTVPLHAVGPVVTGAKRRVAAYARVSTDRDEQFTSYEAQIDYYTNYIKSRPDWEFVSVYSDEGKTGCNTRRREGFKNMVDDALDGKIDLIVTKSVSRFARNTVDSLTTIRKLKDKGVEVHFEKENIWPFDGKGALMLKISQNGEQWKKMQLVKEAMGLAAEGAPVKKVSSEEPRLVQAHQVEGLKKPEHALVTRARERSANVGMPGAKV